MKTLTDVKYQIIPSRHKQFVEVAVTFKLDNVYHPYFIFILKQNKWTDQQYIAEAKKRFAIDYESGKVLLASKGNKKNGWLIATTAFFGIATLALAGLFTWKYLTENTTPGGGGGDDPTGDWVEVTESDVGPGITTGTGIYATIKAFQDKTTSIDETLSKHSTGNLIYTTNGVDLANETEALTYRFNLKDTPYFEASGYDEESQADLFYYFIYRDDITTPSLCLYSSQKDCAKSREDVSFVQTIENTSTKEAAKEKIYEFIKNGFEIPQTIKIEIMSEYLYANGLSGGFHFLSDDEEGGLKFNTLKAFADLTGCPFTYTFSKLRDDNLSLKYETEFGSAELGGTDKRNFEMREGVCMSFHLISTGGEMNDKDLATIDSTTDFEDVAIPDYSDWPTE